jgi:hypothetical protein
MMSPSAETSMQQPPWNAGPKASPLTGALASAVGWAMWVSTARVRSINTDG